MTRPQYVWEYAVHECGRPIFESSIVLSHSTRYLACQSIRDVLLRAHPDLPLSAPEGAAVVTVLERAPWASEGVYMRL